MAKLMFYISWSLESRWNGNTVYNVLLFIIKTQNDSNYATRCLFCCRISTYKIMNLQEGCFIHKAVASINSKCYCNNSLLMWILLLGAGTMWKWAVLLMFQRNILPPPSGMIMQAVYFSQMLTTCLTSTRCHTQKAGSILVNATWHNPSTQVDRVCRAKMYLLVH